MISIKSSLPVCFLVCAIIVSGCSGDPHGKIGMQYKEIAKDRMRCLHMMYSMFNSINMRSPKSEEELRDFIGGDRAKIGMERLGVSPDDFDTFLVSDVDNERFEIVYGLPFQTLPDKGYPYLFDSHGVNGSRRVYFTDGRVLEIEDDDEYERLRKAGIDKTNSRELVQ